MRRGALRIRIGPGTMDDYDALSGFHYVAGDPAVPVRDGVLVARAHGELAGVLVVSMPTLNGSWREQAWPGRYVGSDKRALARRLNREVRTLARCVVEPRFRGQGVARRLVEAYLREPLTDATEAVASMGAVCPFFERAGMTRYELAVSKRDARLADALSYLGYDPWRLVDATTRRRVSRLEFVRRELGIWARACSRTARLAETDPFEALTAAVRRLAAPPVAYAHVRGMT